MKHSRNIIRCVLSMTLVVGSLGWNILPNCLAATAGRTLPGLTSPAPNAVANGKIAFFSWRDGRPEIYTINPDGSELTRLTFSADTATHSENTNPVWSPDGSKIAFGHFYVVSNPGNWESRRDIYVMNADGSNQTRLTNSDEMDDGQAWSSDGTKIAFARGGYLHRDGGIYVMNADGTNQQRLTNFENVGGPVWSPDGTQIAFTRWNPRGVMIMNSDGSDQHVVIDGFISPAWSADGSKLAVLDGTSIWTINADGSNRTKIHEPPPPGPDLVATNDRSAVWSPDGSKIALLTSFCDTSFCDGGEAKIGVVNSDGSNAIAPVGDAGRWPSQPKWSPDSSKLVFDEGGLFLMDRDGTHVEKITDDATDPSWQTLQLQPNLIDDAQVFVRQHYRDFLNREPDPDGLNFWTGEILMCGDDQSCIDAKRINVSGAYFLSIEFQQTGYLVYRLHKTAYGDLPNAPVPIRFAEFLDDTQAIGRGVIVNQTGWEQVLENNKQTFTAEFVQRDRFAAAFPATMTEAEFVDKLNDNAGHPLSQTERDQLVSDLAAGAKSRAEVLRTIVENQNLMNAEFNRAFVLMQYFGYLRRNPNDAPDGSFNGYNFWLDKLNQFNGDFIGAEMVRAFLISSEYRHRFGP